MHTYTKIGIGILAILGIVAVSIGWTAVQPIIAQYGDQQQAANTIRDQVTDGQNAIRQYEWYIDQRQKIDAQRNQINNTRDSIERFKSTYGDNASQWSYTTRQQYNRLLNRLQGYRDQHDNLVADYNAQMNMETRNVYNNSLPLEMEKKFWTGDLIP